MVRLVYSAPDPEPWTEDRMVDLWCRALDGVTLIEMGGHVRASARECDLALWSMIGRPTAEAAEIMNGRRL